MEAMTIVLLVAGLALLIAGGELLVRGGSTLAGAVGLSPLVIGLTVVSSATSAPELAVTVDAALSGSPGLAVGNVVGSNIVNVLLILGVSAVIVPLAVRFQVVRADVPVMVGASVALLLVAVDGGVSRLEGLLLLALLVAYVAWSVVLGRRQQQGSAAPDGATAGRSSGSGFRWLAPVLIVVGVGMLVLGARWLVGAATDIAERAGVSDLVIGLTVVAVGTSLPELATSVVAALRGEREMALGNIVGSNIFNIGGVMGGAALVSPGGIPVEPGAVRFDLPVMLAVAVLLLPLVFTGFTIARWEGGLLVAIYACYVGYLLLDAAGHDALPAFSFVMLAFVVPLVVLLLASVTAYELGLRRGRRER